MKILLLNDYISNSEDDTYSYGKIFGERLKEIFNSKFSVNQSNCVSHESFPEVDFYDHSESATDGIIFVAMYGDLGCGKTVFVKGMTSELAPNSHVMSPSYNIVNEYCSNSIKVCHFDMYRINDDDDLISVGFYDYCNAVIVVEWSEKIPHSLPHEYWRVNLEKVNETQRHITIEYINDGKV